MKQLPGKVSRELKDWVEQGLVSSEQEQRIREQYSTTTASMQWGTVLFSGIGAVGIGLGVILLFAYNWDAIPKLAKLLLIYGAVAGAHGIGIWLYMSSHRSTMLGEACCLLGTMFFGSAIWLVAQIYHIQEHFPNGILIWAIGALLMTFVMPSVAHGLLSAALLVLWCGFEAFEFHTAVHAAPLLFLAGVMVPAWIMRSRILMATAIPAFLVCIGMVLPEACAYHSEAIVLFLVLLNLSIILVAASRLCAQTEKGTYFSPIFASIGWPLFIVGVYIMSFQLMADELLDFHLADLEKVSLLYVLITFVVALAMWGVIAYSHLLSQNRRSAVSWAHYLLPVTAVYTLLTAGVLPVSEFVTSSDNVNEWFVATPYNLFFLAIVLAIMMHGCREKVLKATTLGSIMLIIFAFTRYLDLFESLALRGVVFIVVGGAIFAQGIFYRRAAQTEQTEDDNE